MKRPIQALERIEAFGHQIPFVQIIRNGVGGITGIDTEGHTWMSTSSTKTEIAEYHAEDRKPINDQTFFHAVGVCEECKRPRPQLVK